MKSSTCFKYFLNYIINLGNLEKTMTTFECTSSYVYIVFTTRAVDRDAAVRSGSLLRTLKTRARTFVAFVSR